MVTRHPAANTIAAASGSVRMLYSAAGVVFPRPADPPMITKSATWLASAGCRRTASAMLVSGPVATRVISPGAAATVSMIRSVASASTGRPCAGGRRAWPRPPWPWTSRASTWGRSNGAALPAASGTSGRPAKSSTLSAFAVVWARPTLPATVVTPRTSRPGWPQANASASASSMPGSQSIRTFRGEPAAGCGALIPAGYPDSPGGMRTGLCAGVGAAGRWRCGRPSAGRATWMAVAGRLAHARQRVSSVLSRSTSSSGPRAFSTLFSSSRRRAHHNVPPTARGTVQNCQSGQSASSLATTSPVGFAITPATLETSGNETATYCGIGGGGWPCHCRSRVLARRDRAAGWAGSAGGVQPADRGAVARAAERLELIVPGLAEQPGDLVFQAARPVRERARRAGPRGARHHRGRRRQRHHGAQAALRDEDVAVGHRDRGEDAQIRGAAVADGVAARTGLLGGLEPQPAPAGQRRRDGRGGAGVPLPVEFGPDHSGRRRLAYPRQAHGHANNPRHCPLHM